MLSRTNFDLKSLLSPKSVRLAVKIRRLISCVMSLSVLTELPKYTKSCTDCDVVTRIKFKIPTPALLVLGGNSFVRERGGESGLRHSSVYFLLPTNDIVPEENKEEIEIAGNICCFFFTGFRDKLLYLLLK